MQARILEEVIWKFIAPGDFAIHMFVIFAVLFTDLVLNFSKHTIKFKMFNSTI